jgi:hypothetical protein
VEFSGSAVITCSSESCVQVVDKSIHQSIPRLLSSLNRDNINGEIDDYDNVSSLDHQYIQTIIAVHVKNTFLLGTTFRESRRSW